jgi:hypothetical protein
MVTADKLILEWDALLASSNCLWEIETQAIQMIKWSTNGGRSLFGTKMQGPTAAFEHGIQSDGTSLLADDAAQDKMDVKNVKPPIQAELNHEMSKNWPGGTSWTRRPPTLRIKGSMPNGTMMLEATLGTEHDAPSGNTWHDAWLGKDGNKQGDNSKDENWVFDPSGNPLLAEFSSMADAGKAALCLRSRLPSDAGFAQEFLTETRANNRGAVQMATSQQLTHRAPHIDTKKLLFFIGPRRT